MASKSDMKGFYRQKKNKNGGITKSTNSKSPCAVTTKKSITPKQAAALGSEFTHSPALNVHGSPNLQDDYDRQEELLRQFDLDMAYGPSLGLSRLDRWERAKNLGLNPPRDVEPLLRSNKVRNESLWDGRV
ncbi:uncharacterized protein LOC107810329 [Nicotiana tabacum]|uniref:Uncharacterized protein LOC107810329 n=1 Tax=Nicotiana tabacum TaxID=4097 RepID=A0A1S4BP20_TOBAC|nr:uncharacterized protein LOC104102128 [Nicotiana tomentosiformis]XP_016490583.1 PREDICTED: uncharacterized protein LOC107810329 [Nicotiana tabacum]